MTTQAHNRHIEDAAQTVGSVAALARAINVKPPTVHQWLTKKRPVPIGFCLAIENATGGKVTRKDLRPNDFHLIWPDLAEQVGA